MVFGHFGEKSFFVIMFSSICLGCFHFQLIRTDHSCLFSSRFFLKKIISMLGRITEKTPGLHLSLGKFI